MRPVLFSYICRLSLGYRFRYDLISHSPIDWRRQRCHLTTVLFRSELVVRTTWCWYLLPEGRRGRVGYPSVRGGFTISTKLEIPLLNHFLLGTICLDHADKDWNRDCNYCSEDKHTSYGMRPIHRTPAHRVPSPSADIVKLIVAPVGFLLDTSSVVNSNSVHFSAIVVRVDR